MMFRTVSLPCITDRCGHDRITLVYYLTDASANEMLRQCASEVGCPLYLAPSINTTLGKRTIHLFIRTQAREWLGL